MIVGMGFARLRPTGDRQSAPLQFSCKRVMPGVPAGDAACAEKAWLKYQETFSHCCPKVSARLHGTGRIRPERGRNGSSGTREDHPVVEGADAGFLLPQGAIWRGLAVPVLAYLATSWQLGLAIPMFVGTVVGAPSFIIALLLGPETKGTVLVPDLVVA